MNKKRIIFFVQAQFTKRDYDRFGIERLQNEGYKVEVWDFTLLVFPDIIKKFVPSDLYEYLGLKIIDNLNLSLELIDELDKKDIVIAFGFPNDFKKRKIFYRLSKNNIEYGYNSQNAIPAPKGLNQLLIIKIIKLLFNFNNFPDTFYAKFPMLFPRINPPNFIIAGGTNTVIKSNSTTKIIWTHKLDYDIILNSKGDNRLVDIPEEYVLYLDEYIPFHPDGIYEKWKHIDPEKYYSKMIAFFTEVEKREGCPIVIAAHPRSQYEKHPDYFCGRLVIKGKTMELVQNSKFVFTHASTSLNYAVIFKKPIIFIRLDLIKSIYDHWIKAISVKLGGKIISIDEKVNDVEYNDAKRINNEKYMSYMEKYIKKAGTPEKNTWEIFVEFLRNDEEN